MDELPEPKDNARSNFRLEITLSIGYQRKRALMGKIEGGITTLALLAAGIAVALYVIFTLFHLPFFQ